MGATLWELGLLGLVSVSDPASAFSALRVVALPLSLVPQSLFSFQKEHMLLPP